MSFIQRNQRVRPTMQNLSEAASIGHLDQSVPLMPFNDQQQFPFNDKHMLDFYEHSLIKAFEQVEELKRMRRLRNGGTWKGSCICSSSSSPSSSRLTSVSIRRCGDTFKKSSGSHGRRSRASSIQMGDLKESVTFDGLMLAVDKFLTAEFQKHRVGDKN